MSRKHGRRPQVVDGRIAVPDAMVQVDRPDGLVLVEGGGIGGTPGLEHPGCYRLADVSVDLDCAYCLNCRLNLRISGAWVVWVLGDGR